MVSFQSLSKNKDIWKALVKTVPPTTYLAQTFKDDPSNKQAYRIAIKAIQLSGKYPKNSLKYRLKTESIQNELLDNHLKKIYKQSLIRTTLKNNMIKKYWKDKQKEEIKPKCNCRNEGFGFCFC